MITAERYHDFSCGHRVVGHEGKCRFLHGHNYRVHFVCEAESGALDNVGRVIDFSVMKEKLCAFLEEKWDHRFLVWEKDPILTDLWRRNDPLFRDSFVWVPFNPTAENMARYLLLTVGPLALINTGVRLITARVDETRKCSATASLY